MGEEAKVGKLCIFGLGLSGWLVGYLKVKLFCWWTRGRWKGGKVEVVRIGKSSYMRKAFSKTKFKDKINML